MRQEIKEAIAIGCMIILIGIFIIAALNIIAGK
jgi:hypothetical protein